MKKFREQLKTIILQNSSNAGDYVPDYKYDDLIKDIENFIHIDIIKKHRKEHWDKMGSTGAYDYWEKATKDEIFEFGAFRAIEDLEDELFEDSMEEYTQ